MLTHFVSHSMPTSLSLSPFLLCPISISLSSLLHPFYFFFPTPVETLLSVFFLLDFIPSLPHSLSPPSFFSSHLPLSLPCPPYVSPLNSHVRCCCAVDKTQSLSHPSCTWDPWLCWVCVHVLACMCVCARACMWEKQWEWNKRKKPQPSRMLYNSLMLSCTKPNWNPRCPGPERAPIATRIYGNTTSFIKVFSLPSARL